MVARRVHMALDCDLDGWHQGRDFHLEHCAYVTGPTRQGRQQHASQCHSFPVAASINYARWEFDSLVVLETGIWHVTTQGALGQPHA